MNLSMPRESRNMQDSMPKILVQSVLRGKSNFDEEVKRLDPSKVRLPVTLDVLRLLKLTLSMSELSERKKSLISAVALICFNGCLRVGEVLAKESRRIDPLNTLLRKVT